MRQQTHQSLMRIVIGALLGTTFYLTYNFWNKPPEQHHFYTSSCAAVVEKEWDDLDNICATFPADAEFNEGALILLLQVRDSKLKASGCNPQDEIWSCYPGYQRHYGWKEPNRIMK